MLKQFRRMYKTFKVNGIEKKGLIENISKTIYLADGTSFYEEKYLVSTEFEIVPKDNLEIFGKEYIVEKVVKAFSHFESEVVKKIG